MGGNPIEATLKYKLYKSTSATPTCKSQIAVKESFVESKSVNDIIDNLEFDLSDEEDIKASQINTNYSDGDDDDLKQPEFAVDICNYAVDYEHVKIAIVEFTDSTNTTDEHSANKLLELYDEIAFDKEDFGVTWADIYNEKDGRTKLGSVTGYAETNGKASPDIKVKLRIVTKLLLEAKAESADKLKEYKQVLLLLASHGNVCHIMKEDAICNVYGMMTNNLSKYTESQTLQQQILRVLRTERKLLVERLHHAFKFCNNTHYIADFHNGLAKDLGLRVYNDHEHANTCKNRSSTYKNWENGLVARFNKRLYTMENIMACVLKQIDNKKISYQKIVAFFEENCPAQIEKNKFLEMVIDIDTGKIDERYMHWMLMKMNVLKVKTEEWKEIEVSWEYDEILK